MCHLTNLSFPLFAAKCIEEEAKHQPKKEEGEPKIARTCLWCLVRLMYLQLFGARHIEQEAKLQLKRKVEGEPFVLKRGPGAKLKKRVSNLLHQLVACDLANLFLL